MHNHTRYLAPGEDYKVTHESGRAPYAVCNNRTGRILARHIQIDQAIADANRRASDTTTAMANAKAQRTAANELPASTIKFGDFLRDARANGVTWPADRLSAWYAAEPQSAIRWNSDLLTTLLLEV